MCIFIIIKSFQETTNKNNLSVVSLFKTCGSVPTEVTALSSLESLTKCLFQLLCLKNIFVFLHNPRKILHFQHNFAQSFVLTKILDNKHFHHYISCLLRLAIIT